MQKQYDGGLTMKRFLILVLLIVISFSGCNIKEKENVNDNTDQTMDMQMEEREILLYFANSQAQLVVPEYRKIKVEKDINDADFARIVLEELIKGPEDENLYKTIPEEVKILNIEIQEDTILIDFSKEMHTKHWGGAAGEDMTISSLVNTMTELKGIKRVLPSVEGVALNIEHMIVDEPLNRMEDKIYR